MHTEGVIYSRQHYSLTSLILRVVYCQFCKARHWQYWIPQHFHDIPTSCAILPTMLCAIVLVSCVHRRAVEDSAVGSAHCVVHVDLHGE